MTERTVRGVMVPLAVVIVLVSALPRLAAGNGQSGPAAQKLTFDGDTALWTMAIKPDKTADFEQIMKRMRQALLKSDDPLRRQQAAGWKVMKIGKPLGDGTIAYVHIIHPVVPGGDYTIMQTLYDAFPDERQALYDLYRSAFAQNLSLATGSIAVDLSAEQP